VEFSVVAFNAQGGIGKVRGGPHERFDVARVLKSFDADIVVLPEAFRDGGSDVLDPLMAQGYNVETIEMSRSEDRFADTTHGEVSLRPATHLAVCSRFPVLARREIRLGAVPSTKSRYRPAIALTLDIAGSAVDVIALHASKKLWTLAPLRQLLALKRQLSPRGPQFIAGDFNFWGPPIATVMPGWQRPVRGRTWPSNRPHSQIDHILVRGGITAIDREVLPPTPSDHLAIKARLRLPNL
jgi:endonuclease/exonuclease/phosphatase family metal-dependent hydrolase